MIRLRASLTTLKFWLKRNKTMKAYKRFTTEDHDFIRANIATMTNDEIGAALGRSKSSISWQIQELNLSRNLKKWSVEEVAVIKQLVKTHTLEQLASHFHVTRSSIKAVMRTNGIKTGREGYKTGHVPWCKGKKMPEGWGGATRFKKGSIPHNTKADGDIVTRRFVNGWTCKYIRVSLNNWELLHRFNYKKFIGEIPDGMMVCFKDNNALNCEPSNLKLETKQEHMARNTIARFPPELISTIKLLGKFKRKLKAYEKQD
jgi:DNA-binding transcriptional regulator GbsR (MarR family)